MFHISDQFPGQSFPFRHWLIHNIGRASKLLSLWERKRVNNQSNPSLKLSIAARRDLWTSSRESDFPFESRKTVVNNIIVLKGFQSHVTRLCISNLSATCRSMLWNLSQSINCCMIKENMTGIITIIVRSCLLACLVTQIAGDPQPWSPNICQETGLFQSSLKSSNQSAYIFYPLQEPHRDHLNLLSISNDCKTTMDLFYREYQSKANWTYQRELVIIIIIVIHFIDQFSSTVVDACGRIPAGILSGNTLLWGSYDQCIEVRQSRQGGQPSIQGIFWRVVASCTGKRVRVSDIVWTTIKTLISLNSQSVSRLSNNGIIMGSKIDRAVRSINLFWQWYPSYPFRPIFQ